MEGVNTRAKYLPVRICGNVYWSRSYLKLHNIRNILRMICENYLLEEIEEELTAHFNENDITIRALQILFEKREIAAKGIYEFIDDVIEHTLTQTRLTDEKTWFGILENTYRTFKYIIENE